MTTGVTTVPIKAPHIARREGMRIVTAGAEADAFLHLEPADAASRIGEVLEQAVALFDYALNNQLAASTVMAGALSQRKEASADE